MSRSCTPPSEPRPLVSGARAALLSAVALAAAACPGPTRYVRPAGGGDVAAILAKLEQARSAKTSFRGASVMDYWLGKDRVKGAMLVMGALGAKVRFNALSPAGESVMADLACNGRNFVLVDFQNNCMLAGPCNRDSIGQLLRLSLEPDDFFHLALGQTPVLPEATGSATWDASTGQERLELTSAAGSQTIVLDGREGRWDVLSSELRDPAGQPLWKVENTSFAVLQDAAGKAHRVPGKTRLVQAAQKADLIVEWEDRELNVELDATRFELTAPEGLPQCGAKAAP